MVDFKKKAPTYTEKEDGGGGSSKEKRSVQVQATFRPALALVLPRSKPAARMDKAVSTHHHTKPWPSQHQITPAPAPSSVNDAPRLTKPAVADNVATQWPSQSRQQPPSERLLVVDRALLDKYKVVAVSSSNAKALGTGTAEHMHQPPSRPGNNSSSSSNPSVVVPLPQKAPRP